MGSNDSKLAQRSELLSLDDAGLVSQCEVDTYRASGPGGQKRNKTSSAVRLRHRPTGLISIANESRSQHENKAKAIRRLRETFALEMRSSVDFESYSRSALLVECISQKSGLSVGQKDSRYLHVLSEVLDLLASVRWRVSDAATALGLTTAGLSKFLGKNDKAMAYVNRMRAAEGFGPLR